MNAVRAAVKKAAAILEEALGAANNIASLGEQLEALAQQEDALESGAVSDYFSVPEVVVERVLVSIGEKRSALNRQLVEQVKTIEGAARKMGFVPGHQVEAMLLADPSEGLQLADQVVVRKCTLLEWFMQLRDGLVRESVAIRDDHGHVLFSKYLHDKHLVSLVLDTAALLK